MTPGYVVTVTVPGCGSPCGGEPECERVAESRLEVDTLEEASEVVQAAFRADPHALATTERGEAWRAAMVAVRRLPATGGEVPLPDGSTITVKPVEDDGEGR